MDARGKLLWSSVCLTASRSPFEASSASSERLRERGPFLFSSFEMACRNLLTSSWTASMGRVLTLTRELLILTSMCDGEATLGLDPPADIEEPRV